MRRTGIILSALVVMMIVTMGWSATAYAQGGVTSTLAGTVTDTTGAVVPGADVTAKDNATGTAFTAVTGANGTFTIPAMPTGTYTVTVALQGFKTVVLQDVIINAAQTSSVKAVLELGALEENVVVASSTEIVQTQATAVSQTLGVKQIANLPISGRAAFDLVSYMPGVQSTSGSIRGATVNGLPNSAVNITLDGMNIQDNYAKSWDGMFTRVNPRIDAVEEVTVATAAQGADMAGQGGVQVKFVTRSGTNTYQGSAYYYLQREWMNTNTWLNEHRNVTSTGAAAPKPTINLKQPGFRFGGRVLIPGLYDGRDKFFFFVNYEEVRSPGSRIDTRTIMSPSSEAGIFQYGGGSIDLMALAARNGQTSRIDPLIAKMLGDIRSSTSQGTVNATTDPLTQTLSWTQPTSSTTKFPTVRIDYNLNSKNRVSFSTTRNQLLSDPDTTNTQQRVFPGSNVHGLQDSLRYTGQGSWRSTLSKSLVNEFRVGATGGATKFSPDKNPDMWSNYNGFSMGTSTTGGGWTTFKGITNPTISNANSAREGKTRVFEDTLNWIKGAHAISTGFSYTKADVWQFNQTLVPSVTLGIATGDPADGMFTTANFPGASSTDLTNAKALYAVLTGRITNIGRDARIGADGNTYVILGPSNQYGRLPQYGTFIQDSWRIRQNLTINAGLRYDWQLPFRSLNNSYSMATVDDIFGITGVGTGFVPGSTVSGLGNLFKPGVLQGTATTFKQFDQGKPAYNTDWSNWAPSAGAAWNIGADEGWQRTVFGKPGDSVIRGGYNRSFQRGGMSDFTEVFGANPGISVSSPTRSQANGNLGTIPVLLSSSDLSSPSINLTRTFPMAVPSVSSSVFVFDPNIKTPHSDSYQVGWQRAIAKNTSLEGRYVHTSSSGNWTLANTIGQLNYNELNIIENGFLNEFKLAQQNLQANIAAGRGNTFAYTGAAGTVPLPIMLAYFNGVGASGAGSSANYTGTNWTNTAFVQAMFPMLSNPFPVANSIRGNATLLNNGKTAGMASNFWVVNPDVTGANMVTNGPDTNYNGLQLVLNKRYANGFLFQSQYSLGRANQYTFYSFHKPYVETEQTFSNSGNSNATGSVRQAMSFNYVYELPFGKGKRWGAESGPVWDRIIGGWSWQGVYRAQSGRLLDFGNVQMVGMNAKDLSKSFQVRKITDPANQYRTLVYMLPQDIIDNTMKAFSVTATGYANGAPTGRYLAPANTMQCLETAQTSINASNGGYGDCGTRSLIVQGPWNKRFDMSFIKQLRIAKSVGFEYQLQIFNVFNNVNFTPITGYSTTTNNFANADSYQVTAAVDQARTMQMAFRVTW